MQEGPSTPPPTVTLADRVRQAALVRAGQPALIWRDRTVTWAELDADVDRVAETLRSVTDRNGQPGHPPRVAVALVNSPEFVVAFFATLRAGLVAVPVNPGCTAPELRHVLTDSGAAVLLATERVAGLAASITDALPAPVAVHLGLPERAGTTRPPGTTDPGPSGGDGPGPSGGDGTLGTADPGPEDLAVLLYTSGTEGRPKGAMLTHRALVANHEQIGQLTPPVLGPSDRILLAVPLFHAYGLNTGLGSVAYHGACGVLVDRFDAAETLATIQRHQVTALVGVPSMFLEWSRLDGPTAAGTRAERAPHLAPDPRSALASVRIAVCGAAPLDQAVAARFAAMTGRDVFIGYGLTETAPVLTSTLASPVAKGGSIGRSLPGVRIRLVARDGSEIWRDGPDGYDPTGHDDEPDDFDLGLPSPGSDPGQLVVRGANLFSGYWPDRRGGPDAEGWWATGDIGYADADGDLFLVDRLGELILVNGFNVYPREVELVLDAYPGVVESAVVGVPHPDTGQAVRAYVVCDPGVRVEAAGLLRHCERQLARYKCPGTVEIVETLPHSLIGKVRKTELRSETGA